MNQDMIIASLLAQNILDQETIEAARPIVTVNVHQSTDPFPGIAIGSLDATGFVAALRCAGMRKDAEGKPYRETRSVREDTIKAIHAFVGYDPKGNFGSQESAARAKAQAMLRPIVHGGPCRAEQKEQAKSLAGTGYVQGVPNRNDTSAVLAREEHTVSLILDLKKSLPSLEGTDKIRAQRAIDQAQALLSNLDETLIAMGVRSVPSTRTGL